MAIQFSVLSDFEPEGLDTPASCIRTLGGTLTKEKRKVLYDKSYRGIASDKLLIVRKRHLRLQKQSDKQETVSCLLHRAAVIYIMLRNWSSLSSCSNKFKSNKSTFNFIVLMCVNNLHIYHK